MESMENRHANALELDKILLKLSELTSCADSKERVLSLYPQTSLTHVERLLEQTEQAHILLAKYGSPSFGGLRNVDNSLSRAAAGGVLAMRELLDIAEVLRVIRSLSDWRSSKQMDFTKLDFFFNGLLPNKYLEDLIVNAIISEDEVSDNASDALKDIRRKMRQLSSRLRDQLEKLIHSSRYQKFLQDSIITQRNGRYVVPVKAEYRNEIQGLVHDTSSSGATVFIEPMAVVEANNEIRVLQSKEKDEIERILTALSIEAGSYEDSIKASYESAVSLDIVFAKAQLAYKMKSSAPLLNDKGIIELKRARHPLLDVDKVVPVDIRLGEDFDTLVITGPNTGGKTVAIKTLGLLTLMVMCGLMLPVGDNSRICVFKKVFADIGDEQSIEQSLSTFSSHMTNIINILKHCDDNSLVLIDELGAGTDPIEGAALAMAILERLNELGAKIAATTHYAELKAYALQTYRVENGCCEFDISTLRPTYRLLIGVPGRSNAFAISERLGLEKTVVDNARNLVSAENIRFETLVDSLEKSRLEMENEKGLAKELYMQAKIAKDEANSKLIEAKKLSEKELERAKGEALRLTEQARREAHVLLEEIEKLRKEKKSNSNISELASKARLQMKKSLSSLEASVNPVEQNFIDKDYVLPRPLKVGDAVIVADINKEGVLLTQPDKKGNTEVQVGAMKMRVKHDRLRLLEKASNKYNNVKIDKASIKSDTESRASLNVSNRCDLRGKTVDEAIHELDMFVDGIVMSGLSEFIVVHGKGTGALRAAVQQYMRTHSQIKSFRLGVYGEGENGVTIAQLK